MAGSKKSGARLTHFDAKGRARMVDVGAKEITQREAVAKGSVIVAPATLARIQEGTIGKGDVLGVARLAGIMAAKKTPELIPLCHGIALSAVEIELTCDPKRNAIDVTATCRGNDRTGVEMEAITAVCIASLTVYDMCKAIDRGIRITDVRLTKKSGGKSGKYEAK
ncbi:MAG TPA: cyclic pyranopterin monophosphate synthase MoaC [Magnetospirillaceae bacterium]